MRISHVRINRYKSIKEPVDIYVYDTNILIGKNNCGKSNVLNAIEIALKPKKIVVFCIMKNRVLR